MKIDEFFDAYNAEHIRAYIHLQETGRWPEGFIPEGTEFFPTWQVSLLNKMADCWIEQVKFGNVFGIPTFEQLG